MSNRRPRRSRIYDLNYNIGENYYKSAIDRLDEKSARPASVLLLNRGSEPPPPRSRLLKDETAQDDLEFARDRASHAIRRETVLDQRSGRKNFELEADFDSQVSKTLERIQASKKLLSNLETENGYDNSAEALASSNYIKKRTVKVYSDISSSSAAAESNNEYSNSRWSKLGSSSVNDSESFAALRARQSAARINDIEQDMVDRNERQFLREQRAANVKKLLADTSEFNDDAEFGKVASLKIVKSTQKRITSY
jgi:hypothetical protein